MLGVLLLAFTSTNAQNIYIANTSGDPTVITNWDDVGDGSGANPSDFASGDIFQIPAGISMTVSATNWALSGGSGAGGPQLIIDDGATLTVSGTATVTISAEHVFVLNGNYTHNSTSQIDYKLFNTSLSTVFGGYQNTFGATSTVTIGASLSNWPSTAPSTIMFGNLTITNNSTITSQKNIQFDGYLQIDNGSTLTMNGVTLQHFIGGGGSNTFLGQNGTGTFRTNSVSGSPFPSSKTWQGNVIFYSTSSQTIPSGTYNSISTTTSGNRTFSSAGTIEISGTFTPGTGTYTTTSSTVNFNSTGAQTIPALTSSSYNNLTISNAGTKSLGGSITVLGTLNVAHASGILDINGNTLTIQGTTSLAGYLKGSSTSNLVIAGTGGSSPTIRFNPSTTDTLLNTLTINRTGGGAGVTLSTGVAITNLLNITNGDLNLNGNKLTLKSTSITNTARVGQVSGTISYGSGGVFVVERYIPKTGNGIRAYRDIAPSVNSGSGTIFANWQESGGTGLQGSTYYGTHISGVAGASPGGVDATTGLDLTASGAKSLYSFDVSTSTGDGAWNTGATSTKGTNDTLSAFKGYRILIRGDRRVNLYTAPSPANSMNAAATLRSVGKLVTGNVVYTTSGVTANGATNTGIRLNSASSSGYTLIGNPYACVVDWDALYTDASTSGISSTYTLFDANVGTTGGYATYNQTTGITVPSGSAVNRYIQPGQAFFIQNTTTSPSLTFKETHKSTSTANLTNTFRSSNSTVSKITIDVLKSIAGRGDIILDGVAIAYNSNFSNSIGEEDANKVSNGGENISIVSNAKNLAIEGKVGPTINDSIQLNLWQYSSGINYQLSINTNDFLAGNLQPYLVDKFTNIETALPLGTTTNYSFVTSSTANSYTNRFLIVFKTNSSLPISFLNVSGKLNNGSVNVNWKVNESNIASYEVERSIDGTTFTTLSKIASKGKNGEIVDYNFVDLTPSKDKNYYRIKAIEKDGKKTYSNIVLIKLGDEKQNINVSPNPVVDKKINLAISNLALDTYQVNIYNSNGLLVFKTKLDYSGGTLNQTIQLPRNISAGNYTISLLNEKMKITKSIIVE